MVDMVRMKAKDRLHISSVKAEAMDAGEEFEIGAPEATILESRGLAARVGAKKDAAPANKAEVAAPANKAERRVENPEAAPEPNKPREPLSGASTTGTTATSARRGRPASRKG